MPHRLTLELPDRIRRLWYRYPVSSQQQQLLQKFKNFRRHSAVKSMSVAFYFSVTQFRMYGHTYPEYGILPGSPPGQPPVPGTCTPVPGQPVPGTRYPVPGTRTIPQSPISSRRKKSDPGKSRTLSPLCSTFANSIILLFRPDNSTNSQYHHKFMR